VAAARSRSEPTVAVARAREKLRGTRAGRGPARPAVDVSLAARAGRRSRIRDVATSTRWRRGSIDAASRGVIETHER